MSRMYSQRLCEQVHRRGRKLTIYNFKLSGDTKLKCIEFIVKVIDIYLQDLLGSRSKSLKEICIFMPCGIRTEEVQSVFSG